MLTMWLKPRPYSNLESGPYQSCFVIFIITERSQKRIVKVSLYMDFLTLFCYIKNMQQNCHKQSPPIFLN